MTLLCLHALPLDARMWELQREALRDVEIVTPTLYELGETMDEWADVALSLTDGKVVVAGASMGGYCALAAARRAPERIAGIVLVGSRAEADPPERRPAREEQLRVIAERGAEGLWETMAPRLFSPAAVPAVVERARRIALEQDPEGLARAVRVIRDRPDTREVLRRLGDRSLVILGEDDVFAPPAEVEAPNKTVLPACGHLPGMERATEVNELLRGALERWM